ncbi:carbon monoxide dehydrogenase subunit G [Nocardioides zeae]|uniref:Carbon monoxide dehydrogenase subunit G n=2 Tax=Nocardioides zeae TaxID=1457234 RepID=A0ACC6ILL8_9ACTN|nr:carbon monoxide dehydrogenase subunit G [Nocardioides zeae]MDQ1105278.1 carbon monoxide dehydrogenase subunit G [Nocardioides zeae]MDR6175008.1 carbon monoxide dehydrogenase subunit G [Nocardioides zeae]MDR6211586.1 carbon monoxide dehydrogenase subunit G [Nocardioides zeae]
MKVTGEATLTSSIDALWAAFNDPAVLVATIPGCQQLETVTEDSYRMTISAGVAAIRGTYEGEVHLKDKREPHYLKMVASGAGGPGTIQVEVDVDMEAQGEGTLIRFVADAVVGGMIGGVSQRMLASVGKRLAAEFFKAIDDHLQNGPVPVGPTASAISPTDQTAAETREGGAGNAGSAEGTSEAQRSFSRPGAVSAPAAGGSPDAFLKGTLTGAGLMLVGVLVGALLGRRAR